MAEKTGLFLNVRHPSGVFADAFRIAYYEPFERATGVRIRPKEGGTEPAELMMEMVYKQSYEWDVAVTSRATNLALISGDNRYLEPIGVEGGSMNLVPPDYRDTYFAGDHVYANVLAFRSDAFKDRAKPSSWKDFWDADRFPGRRSLRGHPMDTMEEALLADGVEPARLYPLDADRAFKALSRIRNHVARWWTQAAEQAPLLADNKVDMCAVSNLRAIHAKSLGAPVEVAWSQNIRTISGWGILKGTPRLDVAREFIRFAVDPRRQAEMAKRVAVSPAIPAAADDLSADRLQELPDAHRIGAIEYDAAYWQIQKLPMVAKFESWLASHA